jgi:hypothetical protein
VTPAAPAPVVLAQAADPAEVARTVEEVLAEPRFREAVEGTGLLGRVLGDVEEQLGRWLLDLDPSGGPRSTLAALALVALVAGVVVAVVVALRRLRRGAGAAAAADDAPVGRPPADWAAEAAAHERAGRLREAVRCRYREVVAALAAAGVVEEVPGRTTGEYRRAVATALPAGAAAFTTLSEAFDRAWYGGYPVDEDAYAEVGAASRDVVAAVPGGRRLVGAG